MTQTLANRMTTDTDQVFVACNPLQPQEEVLASNQMAETHGGIVPSIVVATVSYVATFVVGVAAEVAEAAEYIVDELTSREPYGCNCYCNGG